MKFFSYFSPFVPSPFFFSVIPLGWKLLLLDISLISLSFLFALCIIPTSACPEIFNWLYSSLCLTVPILLWVYADPGDYEGAVACCSWHKLGICGFSGSLLSLSLLELNVCVSHYPVYIHKRHCCLGLALAWKRLGKVEWA